MPAGFGGTGSGGGGNYADIAAQQLKLMQEANKPAIASLQASIPETQTRYANEQTRLESQRTPIEQRYQSLLEQVTASGNQATNREQIATSREFGKRGISTQSGIFDQTLNERLLPITQYTQSQTKDLGIAREDTLTQLQNLITQVPDRATAALREIQNSIAGLQSGGSRDAITSALQIFQLQEQAKQADADRALQEKIANMKTTDIGSPYTTIGEGSTLFDLINGRPVYTAPKTYKPGTGIGTGTDPLGLF